MEYLLFKKRIKAYIILFMIIIHGVLNAQVLDTDIEFLFERFEAIASSSTDLADISKTKSNFINSSDKIIALNLYSGAINFCTHLNYHTILYKLINDISGVENKAKVYLIMKEASESIDKDINNIVDNINIVLSYTNKNLIIVTGNDLKKNIRLSIKKIKEINSQLETYFIRNSK
ncbi:MAG: hypothetical protein JW866_07340 [Ignavibacteriales bacterium]|nr:hypothetical protein [Ignavibacteriales bacterium]